MQRIFSKMVLALAAMCGSLLLCKLGLRLFYPKYAYYAESQFTSATGEVQFPSAFPTTAP